MQLAKSILHKALLAGALACILITPAHAQTAKELKTFEAFLSIMDGYFGVIESAYAINENDEKAAVLQLQKIKEIYEDQGSPVTAISYYRDVLKRTSNATLRNTTFMLLGDMLKDQGKHAEAAAIFDQALTENFERLDE